MKKFLFICLFLCCSIYMKADTLPFYADSIRNVDFNYSHYTNIDEQIIENERLMKNIFLGAFIFSIVGVAISVYFSKIKSKQYSNIINLQNVELQKLKLQSTTYGYMLNCAQFPCAMININGNIAWCNEAFFNFFGKDSKTFDFALGTDKDFDKQKVIDTKLPISFHVKTKDTYDKVFGYQRTIIPLPSNSDGSKNFAIIENISI